MKCLLTILFTVLVNFSLNAETTDHASKEKRYGNRSRASGRAVNPEATAVPGILKLALDAIRSEPIDQAEVARYLRLTEDSANRLAEQVDLMKAPPEAFEARRSHFMKIASQLLFLYSALCGPQNDPKSFPEIPYEQMGSLRMSAQHIENSPSAGLSDTEIELHSMVSKAAGSLIGKFAHGTSVPGMAEEAIRRVTSILELTESAMCGEPTTAEMVRQRGETFSANRPKANRGSVGLVD